MKHKSICILGMGYIGLPTACMFAKSGIHVIGIDVNLQVVTALKNGDGHIHEPGLREIVKEVLAAGELVVQDKVEPASAFIIAVPTPLLDDKKADLRAERTRAEAIAPHLAKGNLVVLEFYLYLLQHQI